MYPYASPYIKLNSDYIKGLRARDTESARSNHEEQDWSQLRKGLCDNRTPIVYARKPTIKVEPHETENLYGKEHYCSGKVPAYRAETYI